MTMLRLDRRAMLAGMGALALPMSARGATAADYPALKAFLDGYINSKKLPGGVIAVKRADDPVRFISAGTLAFDTTAPAGPDSLYRIYSMTKPVTGLAVLKLIEDGRLKLDGRLDEILPEFRDPQILVDAATMATRPATKPILIRHLLTHSAGFSYGISNNPLAKLYVKNGIVPGSRAVDKEPGADLPPARDLETLAQRLSKLPIDFEPGSKWQYSVSFDLLGLVIQRASGRSFHDYLRTRIFEPLKMRDTDFMVPQSKLDRFTSVVTLRDGQLTATDDRKSSPFARDRDVPSGGGGLVSSARDYSRFTSMLLNGGALDGVRVVRPETVRLFGSNLLEPGVTFGGRNGYGAGVSVVLPGGERPGMEPPGSYGWFGIAGSQMWVDPSNRTSVILMVQFQPLNAYPVQAEVKAAAYKDLAAIKAGAPQPQPA